MPGRSWPARAWDDLRLAGLKLIFLIVTRAVPLLGLSRREWWWKDAEILMLRHQLAVAERERPRAHPRLDVAGPGVAGAPCGDGGWPGRTSRGDTGGSTASSRGPASRWRHPRSGRSSRAPGSTGLRAGMARAGRSSSGPRRRGSWHWTSSPPACSTARRPASLPSPGTAPRRIRILGATGHPVQSQVVQQARNLLMDWEDAGTRAKFVLHDRDASFTATSGSVFQAAGIRVARSAVQAPRPCDRWQLAAVSGGGHPDFVHVDRPVLRLVPNISSRVTGCRPREAMISAIWGKRWVTVGWLAWPSMTPPGWRYSLARFRRTMVLSRVGSP